jgi:phosphate transport system substrate-binding protein
LNVTRKRIAAVLAVLAVAAVTLTAWTGLASAKQTGTLTGAGSTFVVPLVTQWTQSYHASQVSYSGIGSGGGIAAITARTVDFGASDAPLTPDQASACKGCVQIPWAFSATSIPYHVSGVGYGAEANRTDPGQHLPRHDRLLGQPDDQVDQSGGQAPAREDRAHLSK